MTSSFSKHAGRSLALATLVGASLTLGMFSQASAQTAATPKDGAKPPAAAAGGLLVVLCAAAGPSAPIISAALMTDATATERPREPNEGEKVI